MDFKARQGGQKALIFNKCAHVTFYSCHTIRNFNNKAQRERSTCYLFVF